MREWFTVVNPVRGSPPYVEVGVHWQFEVHRSAPGVLW